MGMLLLLLPGVGELCEDECDEDTVDEEERDVAQFPLPEVVESDRIARNNTNL